ncbi:putative bifunctional diguanylate cyclase/phosphodiesterase [Paenibacillus sp. MBLB4367]|uniref:putative bifunctional diguanylate cyclase/phosphodiesterase n=1 Tax=Paenibacillus sp. MBLB4367 TaxID=3384767 RepID=UPI003907F45C
MFHKKGKVFAIGHLTIPLVLAGLYVTVNRQADMILLIAFSFIWFLLLMYFAFGVGVLSDWLRKRAVWAVALTDYAICLAIHMIPGWAPQAEPHWLILFLIPLYAFELGTLVATAAGFGGLSILLIYHQMKGMSMATLDMLIMIGAMVLIIFFIGPSTDRLNRLAFYDLLTGLPNRHLFKSRLNAALRQADRNRHATAIMFVDLDQFKYVNDNMGHDAGDQLLKVVTERIRNILPAKAMLARMGGDEFTILLSETADSDEAAHIARSAIEAMQQSISINRNEVFLTTSIGIALYPNDAHNANSLMRNAEAAMYRAKEDGRNNFQFYRRQMEEDGTTERVRKEAMLRHAIDRDELVVYYQPRLNTKTGELVCVEALVRWQHPEKGMIPPNDFIPLAEDTGLIVQIGEQVLRKACRQRKRWTDQGLPLFRVSVNLSTRQFRHTELPEVIEQTLKETGLSPDLLELEITETAAMQDAHYAGLMLHVLKETGLTISIDDFGTGYSSLSYLKRFPIDVIKIDRSFISGIHKDSDDAAIVRAIVVLAKTLKLEVTAEGVETSEQIAYLESLGCDEIQGFVIGKPMDADDLVRWHYIRQESMATTG